MCCVRRRKDIALPLPNLSAKNLRTIALLMVTCCRCFMSITRNHHTANTNITLLKHDHGKLLSQVLVISKDFEGRTSLKAPYYGTRYNNVTHADAGMQKLQVRWCSR